MKRTWWLVPFVLALALPAVAGADHPRVTVAVGHRGRLGAEVAAMSDALRGFFGAPVGQGVLVSDVIAGSPAKHAGLAAGDVIVAVEGRDVAEPMDLIAALASKVRGEVVALEVIRGKQRVKLNATLDTDPGASRGDGAMHHFDLDKLPDGAWRGFFSGGDVDLATQLARAQQRIDQLEQRLDALEKKLP